MTDEHSHRDDHPPPHPSGGSMPVGPQLSAAIIDSASDAFVGVSPRGVVTVWNPAAQRLYGYAASEILGQSLGRIIPEHLRCEHKERLAKLRGRWRMDRFDTTRLHKSGRPLEVSIRLSAVCDASGHFLGGVEIAYSLARLRRRQLALASEVRARETVNRMAQAVAVQLDLLRRQSNLLTGDDRVGALEAMERDFRRQAQSVNDLLDASRVLSGQLPLQVQALALPEVIGQSIEAIKGIAAAKDIRIRSCLDADVGPVCADPDRLRQILWNLLSNAVRFTGEGGHVRVLLERAHSNIEISVEDDGIGIRPDVLPCLFDGGRAQDLQFGGNEPFTGLGLAIVKNLVELHGGWVRAMSRGENQGSRFVVVLPLVHARNLPEDVEQRGL